METPYTAGGDAGTRLALVAVARDWCDALFHARCRADASATLDDGPAAETLLRDAERHYTAEFAVAAQQFLRDVADSEVFAICEEVVNRVQAHLGHLATLLATPVELTFGARETGVTALSLRSTVRRQLDRLQRVASCVRAPRFSPLTDLQQRIWDLLRGRALSANEIAFELAGQRGGSCVRRAVSQIRQTGRRIDRRPGVGYFRPDAPPSRLDPTP